MPKTFLWLRYLLMAGLVSLPLGLSGCFQSPTNPFVGAFSDNGCSGNCGDEGELTDVTPTPTTGGSGSISGTISNSGGGTVYVYATDINTYQVYSTNRVGDGAYTISGVANGTYEISALVMSPYDATAYPTEVTVSGSAVTNINLSF